MDSALAVHRLHFGDLGGLGLVGEMTHQAAALDPKLSSTPSTTTRMTWGGSP